MLNVQSFESFSVQSSHYDDDTTVRRLRNKLCNQIENGIISRLIQDASCEMFIQSDFKGTLYKHNISMT